MKIHQIQYSIKKFKKIVAYLSAEVFWFRKQYWDTKILPRCPIIFMFVDLQVLQTLWLPKKT